MSENFTSVMPDCVVGCIAFYCVSGEVERSLAILLFLHDSSHVAVHIFKSEEFRLENYKCRKLNLKRVIRIRRGFNNLSLINKT